MQAGTARIVVRGTAVVVVYCNRQSWLVGERTFATEAAARDFCLSRRLRVLQ
jgi:hypothetical protein